MSYTYERSPDNKAIFVLTISKEQVRAGMKASADELAAGTTIPGFRPGKAPYETIVSRFGEMKLLDMAAENMIRDELVAALLAEDLETVGQPHFHAEKMAPDNDLICKVEIALYPEVTKFPDLSKISVAKEDTTPKDETIARAKKDLALMQTIETKAAADHALTKGDKAVVNLTMRREGVVLEGGESKSHTVFTGEDYFIPGFIDQILGAKVSETKTFTLPFPKEHYQKHLAGQDIDFSVEVTDIFEMQAPEIDDAFATKLGLKDLADLEARLRENLSAENVVEERRRQEREVLDQLVEKATFTELPDILINQEVNKMMHELQHNVEESGAEFDNYLKQLGKSITDLKLDFTPSAIKRIKASILVRHYAQMEKIAIEDAALEAKLDELAERHSDEESKKTIYSPEYGEYMRNQLVNEKAVSNLVNLLVK